MKLKIKADVLEKQVEKFKALVEIYKSEIKYSSQQLTNLSKEKLQILAEKKEKT